MKLISWKEGGILCFLVAIDRRYELAILASRTAKDSHGRGFELETGRRRWTAEVGRVLRAALLQRAVAAAHVGVSCGVMRERWY